MAQYVKAIATDEVSPRTSFGLEGRQSVNHYEHLTSYNEWILGGWMDYEVMPLLRTGLGFNAGFVDVQPGANQSFPWRPQTP